MFCQPPQNEKQKYEAGPGIKTLALESDALPTALLSPAGSQLPIKESTGQQLLVTS